MNGDTHYHVAYTISLKQNKLASMIPKDECALLHGEHQTSNGIIISASTSKSGDTTTANGASSQIMARTIKYPVINLHRNAKCKEEEADLLLNCVSHNSTIIITGHGATSAQSITGGYLLKDSHDDDKTILFSWDLEQYCNLIMDNANLNSGDHLTILLYSCYAGANMQDSMAAKLANMFIERGIHITIVASTQPVARLREQTLQMDAIIPKKLPFLTTGGYKNIRIFEQKPGEDFITMSSVKSDVYLTPKGVMFEIKKSRRLLLASLAMPCDTEENISKVSSTSSPVLTTPAVIFHQPSPDEQIQQSRKAQSQTTPIEENPLFKMHSALIYFNRAHFTTYPRMQQAFLEAYTMMRSNIISFDTIQLIDVNGINKNEARKFNVALNSCRLEISCEETFRQYQNWLDENPTQFTPAPQFLRNQKHMKLIEQISQLGVVSINHQDSASFSKR